MKRLATLVLMLCAAATLQAQEAWNYTKDILFPPADSSWARPYLMTVDASGNLWVITTSSSDTSTHNAVFKAAPGASVFTKVYDFTANNEPESKMGLIGLTSIGTDIVISSRIDNMLGNFYYLPQGDAANKKVFKSGGYGTHMYGIAATRDSFIYSGISAWGVSIRVFNYSKGDAASSAYSQWVAFSTTDGSTAPKEPGGPTLDGSALIRDLALNPKANYDDPKQYFFSTRNSEKGMTNGGIAVWKGGTQRKSPINPEKYVAKRVNDFFGDLSWGTNAPYGITSDSLGRLWACGTDSAKRWVRVYDVDTSGTTAFATMSFELPSKNSANADAKGANMLAPADVALNKQTAYVSDLLAKRVFVFQKQGSTAVTMPQANMPRQYELGQNYPNPFNPATVITYALPKSGMVSLQVFNLIGQKVATLVDGYQNAGRHSVTFNAASRNLPSGMYFYRLSTDGISFTKKMLLSK